MGFRQGAYARIFTIENKGNYSVCSMSISKKNKDSGEYDVDFQSNFVRLVGTAHKEMEGVEIPRSGITKKIDSCDVSSRYDKEKKQMYTNFVVFSFESGEDKPAKADKDVAKKSAPVVEDDTDEPLPF